MHTRKNEPKNNWRGPIAACCQAVLLLASIGCKGEQPAREIHERPGIELANTDGVPLKRTRIVATLDETPLPGENIIWCASFMAAWKELQTSVVFGPVVIPDREDFTNPLNEAVLPDFPKDALFAMAGLERDGIENKIVSGLRQQFPGKAPPHFDLLDPDDVVAYAYLQVQTYFAMPYEVNEEPLVFKAADGTATPIRTFGIQPGHAGASQLRSQPTVVYLDQQGQGKRTYFAVDMCADCSETQVIFARLELKGTLRQTIRRATRLLRPLGSLTGSQTLLAPAIKLKLAHKFSEIVDADLVAGDGVRRIIHDALQDIDFSLTEAGVELKSEARMVPRAGNFVPQEEMLPPDFICDSPFVIMLLQRGSTDPFFVMWVENDDLLTHW